MDSVQIVVSTSGSAKLAPNGLDDEQFVPFRCRVTLLLQ